MELWATNAVYTNDQTEVRHSTKVTRAQRALNLQTSLSDDRADRRYHAAMTEGMFALAGVALGAVRLHQLVADLGTSVAYPGANLTTIGPLQTQLTPGAKDLQAPSEG